ncbi:MAG: DUF1343 domain-containing protein [Bacteroidales bacterium]
MSLSLALLFSSCSHAQQFKKEKQSESFGEQVIVGAERTKDYFPLLSGKRVGIVANQTSHIGNIHLVDSLLYAGINAVKVFGPEHGFRGNTADGVEINSGIDANTGIPIISLYGSHKKPTPEDLEDLDIVVFDIQDVGARFYTYISTMSYVMEACAENNVEFMVLDRPNPHGDYVDGPVLEIGFSSFVGMHPIPVVHGMTVGEYAQMVNGEGWLKDSIQCKLTVISCEKYNHNTIYQLPIAPSPNLPNNIAIQLYPSICFFEGTIISVGRGTDFPFQVIGHPDFAIGSFVFTPEEIPGVAKNPKYKGEQCYGQALQGFEESVVAKERRLHLSLLINMNEYFKEKDDFFTAYFEKLAGSDKLKNQINEGFSEDEIRASWKNDLNEFKKIRKKYLLYPDFE